MSDAPPPPPPPPAPRPLAQHIGYGIGWVLGFTARWTLRAVLVLLLLFLAAYLLIKVPAVQRYVAGEVADAVGEQLGVGVHVGRLDLAPFTSVILEDVRIYDERGDSLVTAARLSAELFQPLRSLWRRELFVESITLEGGRLRLVHDAARPDGNYAFLLPAPRDPADTLLPEPTFHVDLRELVIADTEVDYRNAVAGLDARGVVGDVEVLLQRFDPPAASRATTCASPDSTSTCAATRPPPRPSPRPTPRARRRPPEPPRRRWPSSPSPSRSGG